MEKPKSQNPFPKNTLHRRQLSDSSNPYCSLTPNISRKNLNLDRLHTETSQSPSKCVSPSSTHRISKEPINKAISLVIIEKYFSDICQNIANKNSIDKSLLSKAVTMQDVLKDCLTAVPDISLQFYMLMAAALKEIQQIHATRDCNLYVPLAKKLVQVAGMLEVNNYTSEVDRVATLPNEELSEVHGLKKIEQELLLRISRVTARVLDLWKKILSPQREAAVISCSFLLLYCEVDSSLKILPTARIPAEKAVSSMKLYLSNPGYVVTIIRKTKEFIENEQISVETIKRIHDLLEKVTVEQVKNVDKTLTGFAIYELVYFAVMFYQEYAKEHYKIDIFDEEEEEKSRVSVGLNVREEVKGENEVPKLKNGKIIAKSVERIEKIAEVRKVMEKKVETSEKNGEKVKKGIERSQQCFEKKEKPLSSVQKPVCSSQKGTVSVKTQRILEKPSKIIEKPSRIIEKTPRVSERPVITHHKSRSCLYSPAGVSKDLQRNNSNSSSKNLLPDRKSLNVFRK